MASVSGRADGRHVHSPPSSRWDSGAGTPPADARRAVVGLVTHSGAAQDVRRLTSLARTIDVHERVNAMARVLAGLAGVPDVQVHHLSEPTRVVERALATLGALPEAIAVDARPARAPQARDAAGTRRTAAALAEAGAACVVTYGGDGTNRAVAAGWPDAVMIPLPGGTNNAFAQRVDPTAAGLAAALYATDPGAFAADVRRAPRWRIAVAGRPEEIALVDVALVSDEWIGAHAVWDPERLIEAVVVHADPTVPGLAGVAGMATTAGGAPPGVHLSFGRPGRRVLAALGPGRLTPLCVSAVRRVGVGEPVTMRGPGTLALDGEREMVLRAGETARVSLAADGPRILDAAAVLRAHADGRTARPHTTCPPTTVGGT